jgi:RNA polymerase sigma-70 factor (ECF subfamily)
LIPLPLTEVVAVDNARPPAETANCVAVLTRGLAAGDEAAFREFHELYFGRLYQFLLVVTHGQEESAREALQQTLLRVVRYARPFTSEEIFWSWLKVLARSAARDVGRKQRRYASLLQAFALWKHEASPPSPEERESPLVSALEEGLEELEPADRELLAGKYLEGASVKELSTRAGTTEKAVESRLLRLRRLLRERLLASLRSP